LERRSRKSARDATTRLPYHLLTLAVTHDCHFGLTAMREDAALLSGPLEHVSMKLMYGRDTRSVCSPPPCGEGSGVGVPRIGDDGASSHHPSPTLLQPAAGLPASGNSKSDQTPGFGWGRERTERVAALITRHRNVL
jgi:hypothetical protein